MQFNTIGKHAQATVLRGFSRQIDKLNKPDLPTVQQLAADVGLMIITTEQYAEILDQIKLLETELTEATIDSNTLADGYTNIVDRIKFLLVTHDSAENKLEAIYKLLNTENATV